MQKLWLLIFYNDIHGLEIVSEKKSTFSGQWAKRRRQASTKWVRNRFGEDVEMVSEKKSTRFANRLGEKIHTKAGRNSRWAKRRRQASAEIRKELKD